jgi:hypothetical protein
MSALQYLESMLAKYNLTEGEIANMRGRRAQVESIFRTAMGPQIEAIYYSGSFGKGTAIRLGFDLDICLYFKRDSFGNLHEMYSAVLDVLEAEDFDVVPQTVSIHADLGGTGVDIVPARSLSDGSGNANLYVTTLNTSLQTNIPAHRDYISKSEARPVIKLMKAWRDLHSIHFKSFALELLVIKALENTRPEVPLDQQFMSALRFAAEQTTRVKLVDPANMNNIVSDLIPINDKLDLQNQAAASITKKTWQEIIS